MQTLWTQLSRLLDITFTLWIIVTVVFWRALSHPARICRILVYIWILFFCCMYSNGKGFTARRSVGKKRVLFDSKRWRLTLTRLRATPDIILRKTVLHTCSDVDPSWSPCLKTIDRKSFERASFLVFHPVLLKIAYFKSANWQLSIDVQPKELRQRKFVDPSRAEP